MASDRFAWTMAWVASVSVAFTWGETWGKKIEREKQLMTITPEDAKRLLLSAQPFPHGAQNEIYVSVAGTRHALLGREPNVIQDAPFYMRPDIADGVAVYVMNKDTLERLAYRQAAVSR